MRVVAIDPAPRGGLTIFDGQDRHVPIREASAYIRDLSREDDVLVCWDAPLTGPSRAALNGGDGSLPADFTQRPIDSFFSRKSTSFKTPAGISVLPYSGCSHWTITRHLLGLPRVGPWDLGFDALPFELACDQEKRPIRGKWVVEIHPAVAAWLWCRDQWVLDSWKYKKNTAVREELWRRLVNELPQLFESLEAPLDDDQLDARIGYALGQLWVADSDRVVLLGDLDQWTFLVPAVEGLEAGFRTFVNGRK